MKHRAVAAPLLPLLLLLFIGSGCSALIYEIVWSQLLELVIGVSAISLSVLLGTFMGGMCLGSLLFPRLVSPDGHPLRVYAVLELGTAVFALLILFGMPYVGALYGSIGAFGFWGIVVRATICIVCLMPPTMLMGATLPAIARWVQTTPRGIAWLGFFYGGNIAGAVLGCVLAGFYLLRVYDMAVATYVAASINTGVAFAAFLFSRFAKYSPAQSDYKQSKPASFPESWSVYAAIALSGMAALGAEVIWTRLLSMLFGASVYAFSIILAVFLTALGIGSSRASAMSQRSTNPRRDLAVCQALLIAAIAWSAYMTNSSLPYWPVNPTLTMSMWQSFQMDIFRCALAIGPAALLWGASFPLALAAAATKGQDSGRLVGGVYAANTIGGIAGVAVFSLVFVAGYGTQQAQQSLMIVSLAAALLAITPPGLNRRSFIPVIIAVVFAGVFILTVPRVPGGFVAYGRFFANASYNLRKDKPEVIYSAEGVNAAVAVTQLSSGTRNFHVAGKIEASTDPRDMKMQRMLGHLPALYNSAPRSILVVGFGAGVTAGVFTLYPSVQRIVICEIEPLIPQAIAEYFRKQNYDVLKDPRVQIVYDDARNFMRTTHEKFDVISYDSIHPWVKGAASLYTGEYFKLAGEHLNPGGTISLWVPLYECSTEAAKSQIATFIKVFPNGTLWGNTPEGAGYDLVLMAKQGDPTIDLAQLTERLSRQDHLNVKYSLEDIGIHSAVDLAGLYAGRGRDLAPWLADAQINDDRSLRLQYLAGLSLNDYNQNAIYNAILGYSRFPDDLFSGPNDLKDAVRKALPHAANAS
jgi:spermidine synthase